MQQNIKLFAFLAISFFSCKKDKPDEAKNDLPKSSSHKILVVCEGSLGNGNASLSVYNPVTDSIYNKVFETANGTALGDIFQSITKQGNNYFLSINNSDKILVVDAQNWLLKTSISIPKPRNIVSVNGSKMYVGSLFNNKIYVINSDNYSVSKTIEMPFQNVEGILIKGDYAYVCCWDTACRKLYQINTVTDLIEDSTILAGRAAHTILIDKNEDVWVLGGNVAKGKSASFSKIDLKNKRITQTLQFPAGVEVIKACFNATKDSLYFIEVDYNGGTANNGIYRMPISSLILPINAFIPCQANQYFWALGIDPKSNKIYIGDPKGFVQKGTVLIYDAEGEQQRQFNVGLGVSSFYFD